VARVPDREPDEGPFSLFPFGRGQRTEVVVNLWQLASGILETGSRGRRVCPWVGSHICQPEAEVFKDVPDDELIGDERDNAHGSPAFYHVKGRPSCGKQAISNRYLRPVFRIPARKVLLSGFCTSSEVKGNASMSVQ